MEKINKPIKYLSAVGTCVLFFSVFQIGPAKAEGISTNDVIRLLNQSRVAGGLKEVKENLKLDQAARAKAEDMVKNDYFAHTSPTGVDPWHWFREVGYDYKFAGENLAVNYASAEAQHKAWMKSPTHRKNILNENYQEVGVAVVASNINGEKSLLTVELFGAPLYVPVGAAPEGDKVLPEMQKVAGEESIPLSNEDEKAVLEKTDSAKAAPTSPGVDALSVFWLAALAVLWATFLAGPLVFLLKGWNILFGQGLFFRKKSATASL